MENEEIMENPETAEAPSQEQVQLVQGLCAFHFVSIDRSQRLCHYQMYDYPVDSRFVIKDAQEWYRLMLTTLKAEEKDYQLVINILESAQ